MQAPAERNANSQVEAYRKEIDALFRAAQRRNAERAAAAARDLGLDKLAERFMAEAQEQHKD